MRLLLILLLFPFLCNAQIAIPGLAPIVVTGSSQGIIVAVDTSYENITYNLHITIQYNPLRPNKKVILAGDCSFFMNGVPVGKSGNVRFIFTTGTENLQVNGIQNSSPPGVPGLFSETYQNILSLINWTSP